jgi:hypothetical protein
LHCPCGVHRSIVMALSLGLQSSEVEHTCSECHFPKAVVQHRVISLPRILILQLKRFTIDMRTLACDKRSDAVEINQQLCLGTSNSTPGSRTCRLTPLVQIHGATKTQHRLRATVDLSVPTPWMRMQRPRKRSRSPRARRPSSKKPNGSTLITPPKSHHFRPRKCLTGNSWIGL